METILVTGGSGALGHSIRKVFDKERSTDNLYSPFHSKLDIRSLCQVEDTIRQKTPSEIIHCAALTNLEYCEKNPGEAFETNVLGTINLAKSAKKYGGHLVYISSEAVFSGKKGKPYTTTDIPKSPQNFYGWTKLLGEWWAKKILPDTTIIRLSWLFGPNREKDQKFVTKISELITQGKKVRAINDVRGSPTYSTDAASRILELAQERKRGIYHVVNAGTATRLDMAILIQEHLGIPKPIIQGVSYSEFPKSIERNKWAVLKSKNPMRNWKEALKVYLRKEFS